MKTQRLFANNGIALLALMEKERRMIEKHNGLDVIAVDYDLINGCESCVFGSDSCGGVECTSERRQDGREVMFILADKQPATSVSNGSSADYYDLPEGATRLQDLISFRNMNAQDGEIFRAIYRKGHCPHSSLLREAKKVLFYAQAEVDRLEKLG